MSGHSLQTEGGNQKIRAWELLAAATSLFVIAGGIEAAEFGPSSFASILTYFASGAFAGASVVTAISEHSTKWAIALAFLLIVALGLSSGLVLGPGDSSQASAAQKRYARHLGQVLETLQRAWARANHGLEVVTDRGQEQRLSGHLEAAFMTAAKRLRRLKLARPERVLNRHIADRLQVLSNSYRRLAAASVAKTGEQFLLNNAVARAQNAARRLRRAELQLFSYEYARAPR